MGTLLALSRGIVSPRIAPLPVLLLLALGTAPAAAEPFVKHLPARDRVVVALEFGAVEVVPHDAAEIRIEARATGLGASSVRFDARAREGHVLVTGRVEPWVTHLRASPSVRVRAFVPPGTDVSVERGAARVPVPAAWAGVPLR